MVLFYFYWTFFGFLLLLFYLIIDILCWKKRLEALICFIVKSFDIMLIPMFLYTIYLSIWIGFYFGLKIAGVKLP